MNSSKPVCPLLNLLYQLVSRMRNSRILVIAEMDLGLNRFVSDSQYKDYLTVRSFISTSRDRYNAPQQFGLEIKYSCVWAVIWIGWGSGMEPETLYVHIKFVAVFFLPAATLVKSRARPSANQRPAFSKSKTNENRNAHVCQHSWCYYLTHLTNIYKVIFITFQH